jgi:transcription initiation factor TFIID subunit 7
MSSTPRPALKLKLPSGRFPTTQPSDPRRTTTETPTSTKLKLKFGAKTPSQETPASIQSTPASSSAKKSKAATNGNTPSSSKKRRKAAADDGSPDELAQDTIALQPKPKKLKLDIKARAPKAEKAVIGKPRIISKVKGRAPTRELGVGYDSEASDREEDPAIEEELILRMEPGEDCEYLRKAVEERRFGLKKDGGVDVGMKFLQKDGRRAVVFIQGRIYAASLVDLPCIIEGMKSWDKKGWWKSADICQMLLVLGKVNSEEEARIYPLPKEVEPHTFQFAHGLTPPMHYVRRRRFRKRISNRTIEAVEDEVNRLLEADEKCLEYVRNEIVDPNLETHDDGEDSDEDDQPRNLLEDTGLVEEEYDDEDAEGEEEISYTNGDGHVDEDGAIDFADELQMELDKALAEDAGSEAPSSFLEVNGGESGIGESSAAVTPAGQGGESIDESSDGDEDDEGDEDDVDDDDLKEQQQALAQQREEIADLETAIRNQYAEHERQGNPILKNKIRVKIRSLEQDLALKKNAIGEDD